MSFVETNTAILINLLTLTYFISSDRLSTTDYVYDKLHPFLELIKLQNHLLLWLGEKVVIMETAIVSLLTAFSSPILSLHFRVGHCHSGSLHLVAIILDFTLQFVRGLDIPYFQRTGFMRVICVILTMFLFYSCLL